MSTPTQEKAVQDLKAAMNDVEAVINEYAQHAGNGVDHVRKELGDALSLAALRLTQAKEVAVKQAEASAHAADNFVHRNPWQSIGVAAGAAFLIGLLIGRR